MERVKPSLPTLSIFAPLVVFFAQIAYYRPRLPTRVASHFDFQGQPDGFMARDSFLLLIGGITVGIAVLFAFLIWVLPRTPKSMVNVPHRDYWLADERVEESMRVIVWNLVGHAVLTIALLCYLLHEMYLVNVGGDSARGIQFWMPIGVYLAGTITLIALLYRRFRLPADARAQ